jgi:amino acid transporter
MFGRAYAAYYLNEHDPLFDRARARLRLEHGLLAGGALLLAGLILCAIIAAIWIDRGFGALSEEKLAVVGLTLVVLGIQVVFGSFFLSILGLSRRPRPSDELAPH